MPRAASDPSRSGVYGSPECVSRQGREETTRFSLNEGIKDYWTEKMNGSAASAASTGQTRDPSRPPLQIPDLRNGHGPKLPPDKAGADTQAAKRLPQTIHFPIRPAPAPVTKSQLPKLPKQKKEIDVSRFDALIYSQPGASTPPPGLDINPLDPPSSATANPKEPAQPKATATKDQANPADEPLFADIDPRIHWPQPHSAAWHAAKQAEIRARGGRKANFGRAAHSLRRQLRQQSAGRARPFEDSLPDKILDNPAWVRALRRLRGLPAEGEAGFGGSGGGEAVPKRGGRKHGVGGAGGKRVGSGSGSGLWSGWGSVNGVGIGNGIGR